MTTTTPFGAANTAVLGEPKVQIARYQGLRSANSLGFTRSRHAPISSASSSLIRAVATLWKVVFKGPVELAAVGVSIALFNQASRIAILPLLSVATSFVAEEDTIGTASPKANQSDYLETGLSINGETKQLIPKRGTDQNAYNSKPVGASFEIVTTNHRKRYIPSVSPAMVIGSILGLIQAIFLISAAKPLLNFMGVSFGYLVVDEEPLAIVPLGIDLVDDYPHTASMVCIPLNHDSCIVQPHPHLQRPSSFVRDVDYMVHWQYPNSNICELADVLKNLFRSQTPIVRKPEYCHCRAMFTDECDCPRPQEGLQLR